MIYKVFYRSPGSTLSDKIDIMIVNRGGALGKVLFFVMEKSVKGVADLDHNDKGVTVGVGKVRFQPAVAIIVQMKKVPRQFILNV